MALQSLASRSIVISEDVVDLQAWLAGLSGCPPIAGTRALRCPSPAHGAEAATWFFVEADAAAGVARWRCVGCASVGQLLDSEHRWTDPAMAACASCSQSMTELALGWHLDEADPRAVSWLALAMRCVGCGRVAGLTDACVDRLPLGELLSRL